MKTTALCNLAYYQSEVTLWFIIRFSIITRSCTTPV